MAEVCFLIFISMTPPQMMLNFQYISGGHCRLAREHSALSSLIRSISLLYWKGYPTPRRPTMRMMPTYNETDADGDYDEDADEDDRGVTPQRLYISKITFIL